MFAKKIKDNEIISYNKKSQVCGREKYEQIETCRANKQWKIIGTIEKNEKI